MSKHHQHVDVEVLCQVEQLLAAVPLVDDRDHGSDPTVAPRADRPPIAADTVTALPQRG